MGMPSTARTTRMVEGPNTGFWEKGVSVAPGRPGSPCPAGHSPSTLPARLILARHVGNVRELHRRASPLQLSCACSQPQSCNPLLRKYSAGQGILANVTFIRKNRKQPQHGSQ